MIRCIRQATTRGQFLGGVLAFLVVLGQATMSQASFGLSFWSASGPGLGGFNLDLSNQPAPGNDDVVGSSANVIQVLEKNVQFRQLHRF